MWSAGGTKAVRHPAEADHPVTYVKRCCPTAADPSSKLRIMPLVIDFGALL